MSKDYTKFSNGHRAPVAETNNAKTVEPVLEEVTSEVLPEPVLEEVATDPVEETKMGVVTDCARLNVRANPTLDGRVLCVLDCESELAVYEAESTEEFYKVCTAAGVEGYCMKKFITLIP